jgi:hypothetical protein
MESTLCHWGRLSLVQLKTQPYRNVCWRTDALEDTWQTVRMRSEPKPRVIAADRLRMGVMITFDDGKCAFYSAELLDTIFSQAEEVPKAEDEGENSN